jgi:hypothetical protein
MATLQRYLPSAPSQLLGHILDRPELVAAVRELPGTTLWRLIERVGLEDCGELIALASSEQLEAMFDADLWGPDASGFEDRFDPQRFLLWLQLMGEAGDDALARRLCALPLDLLTLAVHRLVLVIDMDALLACLAGARDEAGEIERALENSTYEEWEEFRLIARDADAWADVWNALLLLDREHHAHLRGILERCCAMSTEYINGQGGLYEVLTSDEMLESDALAEREDRRAQLGFVSRGDAHSFLELARSGQVTGERDPITAAYFRAIDAPEQTARAAGVRRLTASAGGADLDGLLQLIAMSDPDAGERRSAPRVLPRSNAPQPAQVKRPGAGAKARASGPQQPQPRRRSGTRKRAVQTQELAPRGPVISRANRELSAKIPLVEALAALASEHPTAHGARMEELGYLANVLLAGCMRAGSKLRPVEALEAAVATCNLGLELWERAELPPGRESAAQLLQHVSCDRLFRVAWSALQRELVQPARSLLAQRCPRLHADTARRAQKLVQGGAASALRTLCDASELGLDEETFEVLLALAEAAPWLAPTKTRADGRPWLASRADLERCRALLRAVAR